ncbi:MAG: branched-chain amino acid ABC transporter permease [Chloroflexi bacterium]|nr:branched-chain amino acid ABC transporter permease [Chloroflexota bacterium]
MTKGTTRNLSAVIAGGIFLLALPLFLKSPYFLHMLIMTMLAIIYAVTLRPLVITGQLSLAHAAFVGIGAYASALLVTRLGISFWLALPMSGLIAALIAVIIGFPALRAKGLFFAIVTFGFTEVARYTYMGVTSLFGGPAGFRGITPPVLAGIQFGGNKVAYYYLMAFLLTITLLAWYSLEKSRFMLTVRAIGKAENLAEAVGVNLTKYKMVTFVFAAFFTGIAGSFYAHYNLYIAPINFSVWQSIAFLTLVVVGGKERFIGPIVGAIFLTFIPEFLHGTGYFQAMLYGGLMVLTVLFMPNGLIGIPGQIAALTSRLRKVRKAGWPFSKPAS